MATWRTTALVHRWVTTLPCTTSSGDWSGTRRPRCRQAETPLIVLDHGKPAIPAMRAWCEANDVPCHPFTFTDEEWSSGVRISAADAHANVRGNELLYEKARRALVAAGQLAAGDAQ